MIRPLYNELVPYYELLEGRDWVAEAERVSSVLRRHGCKSVIDLGCGTGRHVRELARLGFDATGIDISRHNISFARRKAADEGVKAHFVCGSYYDLSRSEQFDAAVCLNWSIPVKDDQIRRILRKANTLLRQRGILVFDYERTSEIVWEDVGKPIVETWVQKGKVIARVSVGRMRSDILVSDDVYLTFFTPPAAIPKDEASRYRAVEQEGSVKAYVDRSFVRFFSPTELRRLARVSGFERAAEFALPRKGYRRCYAVLVKKA